MIFGLVQSKLEEQHFKIVDKDLMRPWGGFFVIAEDQAQQFANQYFDGLDVSTLKKKKMEH